VDLCWARHGTPSSMYLKRLSSTQMNESREDTVQEPKRCQVKRHGVWTEAGGGPPWQRTGIPQTTDNWPIFPDNTDWVSPTWSSGATLQANGFESGSAIIPPLANGHSGGNFDHVYKHHQWSTFTSFPWWRRQRWSLKRRAFIHKWHGLLPEKILSSSVAVQAWSLIRIRMLIMWVQSNNAPHSEFH
jgi:hypothetical protein